MTGDKAQQQLSNTKVFCVAAHVKGPELWLKLDVRLAETDTSNRVWA